MFNVSKISYHINVIYKIKLKSIFYIFGEKNINHSNKIRSTDLLHIYLKE